MNPKLNLRRFKKVIGFISLLPLAIGLYLWLQNGLLVFGISLTVLGAAGIAFDIFANPAPGQIQQRSSLFDVCPNCNHKRMGDSGFCTNCGKALVKI